MAFTYTLCEARESTFSIKGSSGGGINRVSHTVSQTFKVLTSALTPADVTDVQVGCLSGLPVVNRSTWYSSITGASMPFAVCRSKDVKRNAGNAFLFDVTCTFETGDIEAEQCAVAEPPVDLTDITPIETAKIGSYDRVIYQDKSEPAKQCFKYDGTETPFAVDIVEKIPTLSIVIEQFEASITYEQMMERSFKVNDATYRTKDAGLWMIGEVQAVEQEVQLQSGLTVCAKVTYPIMLSERYFYPPGVNSSNVANKTIYGHETVVPLVDTMYLDGADVKVNEENGSVVPGYINTDGTKRTPAGVEDERPDYLRFKTLESIDFSSFLQV
jgi:hypothetical protein